MRVFPVLAAVLLQLLAASDYADATISCAKPTLDPTKAATPARVLVVLSTCLTAATRSTIDTWLGNLKSREMIFLSTDAEAVKIEYDYKVLQDTLTCGGAIDPTKNLAKMAAAEFTKYSGLISFATTPRSTTALEFAATNIGYAAKFQVCEKSLSGADEDRGCKKDPNYIYLANVPSELPNFNPFRQVVSKLYCATALKRGLAYSTGTGVTQTCECKCPPDMELDGTGAACKPSAESIASCDWWSSSSTGVRTFEITPTTKTALTNGCSVSKLNTIFGLSVPALTAISVSTDDDGIVNYGTLVTSTSVGAEISRVATTLVKKGVVPVDEKAAVVPTEKYTWGSYLSSTATKINRITLPGYGNYYVAMYASDYRSSGRCGGVFSIVDKYRPTNEITKCGSPPKKNDGPVIPTDLRIAILNNEINSVYSFKRTATNDACSVALKNRCDEDVLTVKKFADSASKSGVAFATGEGFYAKDLVAADLAAKLATTATVPPDPTYTCTRCARAATTLKEWWTDYQGNAATVNQTCDGDSACDITRCLVVTGTTLVTATVKIEGSLKIKSADVAAKLLIANPGETYTADDTNIYLPLDCSAYLTDPPTSAAPNACTFRSKVFNMFTLTAAATRDSILQAITSYVRWEYQIDGGSWKKLASTTADEVFYSPTTAVTIRAWTNCGVAVQKTFYVRLHVNNDVNVCDSFDTMWLQSGLSADLASDSSELCLLPKSNFADLGFAFDVNSVAIEQQSDKFKLDISSVQCQLQYDNRAPLSIFSVTSPSTISKEFAVTTTRSPTLLTTTCFFTYTRPALVGTATSTSVKKCIKEFTVRDCTEAVASTPVASDAMCAKQCDADPTIANLYEACDGDLISGSSLSQGERTCCDSCLSGSSYKVECVLATDGPATIKRCEPVDK